MAKASTTETEAAAATETAAETKTARTAKKKVAAESVYTAEELAGNARKVFGTSPDCVSAALARAGKKNATVSEAKSIVETFLKKEVK